MAVRQSWSSAYTSHIQISSRDNCLKIITREGVHQKFLDCLGRISVFRPFEIKHIMNLFSFGRTLFPSQLPSLKFIGGSNYLCGCKVNGLITCTWIYFMELFKMAVTILFLFIILLLWNHFRVTWVKKYLFILYKKGLSWCHIYSWTLLCRY